MSNNHITDDELIELAHQFVSSQGDNTRSALSMGGLLHHQRLAAVSDKRFAEAVRAAGGKPPSASRMSVYRSAYTVWLVDASYEYSEAGGPPFTLDDLAAFSIDTLYHAGRLIGRVNEQGSVISHVDALELAEQLSDKQIRALVSKTSGKETGSGDEEQPEESGLRTLTMNVDAYEAIEEFALRLARAAGVVEVSKSKALLFALSQVNTLDDGSLDYLWREAHGEVDEEEAAEVRTIVLDVEDEGGN